MTVAPATIVLAADLAGDDRYHVGDEAMAEKLVGELRAAGRITVTSSNPPHTSRRLGCSAVPWVGFDQCGDEPSRTALLAALTARLNDPPDSLPPLMAAAQQADAIVIAGGGNLNSHWPHHIHERVLLGRMAAHRGIPLVITSQTVGPTLTPEHRVLVAELLGRARLAGMRDPTSVDLARSLGVAPATLFEQADDAVMLAGHRPNPLPPDLGQFIAVTIHPFAHPDDPRPEALADQLAAVAHPASLNLLFVPHMRGAEGPEGTSDVDMAHRLGTHTGGHVLKVPDARTAAWAAHNAVAVVSSRYHPLVFASAAGVPALGLPCDAYTAAKCGGALGHIGLASWMLDLDAACSGQLAPALEELVDRRRTISRWARRRRHHLAHLDAERRRRLATAVGLGGSPTPVRPRWHGLGSAPRPRGSWARGLPAAPS